MSYRFGLFLAKPLVKNPKVEMVVELVKMDMVILVLEHRVYPQVQEFLFLMTLVSHVMNQLIRMAELSTNVMVVMIGMVNMTV